MLDKDLWCHGQKLRTRVTRVTRVTRDKISSLVGWRSFHDHHVTDDAVRGWCLRAQRTDGELSL
jgi:hypothetical protein